MSDAKWKIRFDIMRRLPSAQYQSVCMHPSSDMGFETIAEANAVLCSLQEVDAKLQDVQTSAPTSYEIWPMAVHEDFGKMIFDDGDDTDEDEDVDGVVAKANGSNYS